MCGIPGNSNNLIFLTPWNCVFKLAQRNVVSIIHCTIIQSTTKFLMIIVLLRKLTDLLFIFYSAKQLVRGEPNVSYICSRYYRAPELIFGATDYTSSIG